MLSTLAANIELMTQEYLTSKFKPLEYVLDIEKNANLRYSDRFGIIMREGPVTSGVLGRVTIAQICEIVITNSYKEMSSEKIGDQIAREKANEIADLLGNLTTHLANHKCNTVGVLNVTLLQVSDATYIDDKNIVYRSAQIEILFRI